MHHGKDIDKGCTEIIGSFGLRQQRLRSGSLSGYYRSRRCAGKSRSFSRSYLSKETQRTALCTEISDIFKKLRHLSIAAHTAYMRKLYANPAAFAYGSQLVCCSKYFVDVLTNMGSCDFITFAAEFGSFARFIANYIRPGKISLSEGISKMTTMAANRLHLPNFLLFSAKRIWVSFGSYIEQHIQQDLVPTLFSYSFS